jgi:hypothetical protein
MHNIIHVDICNIVNGITYVNRQPLAVTQSSSITNNDQFTCICVFRCLICPVLPVACSPLLRYFAHLYIDLNLLLLQHMQSSHVPVTANYKAIASLRTHQQHHHQCRYTTHDYTIYYTLTLAVITIAALTTEVVVSNICFTV